VGCSSSFGGGAPSATSSCGVACEARGRSFAPGGSAHATCSYRFNWSMAQPSARSERCPQAAPRKAVAFHAQASRLACRRRDPNVNGVEVVSLPAHLERGGLARAPRHSKERRGRRGQTLKAQGSKRVVCTSGRGSDARGVCPRVVGLFAEVDRRRRTQRSVRSPIHPNLEGVRGRGSSLRLTCERESAAQGRR
jgi:hypothetical protein